MVQPHNCKSRDGSARISHTIVGGLFELFSEQGGANVSPSLAVLVLLQYLHSQLCKQIYQFYNKFQFQLYFFSQYFYNYYYCYKFGRSTIENWCNGFFHWIGLYTWNSCISYFRFILPIWIEFLFLDSHFAFWASRSPSSRVIWIFYLNVHGSPFREWEMGSWIDGETLAGAVGRGMTIDDDLCNAIIAFTYHQWIFSRLKMWHGMGEWTRRSKTEQNNGRQQKKTLI